MTIAIAIDVMGGGGPSVTIPACLSSSKSLTDVHLHLFGTQEAFSSLEDSLPSNVSIHPCEEVVSDDDSVAFALKHKKKSTMRVALDHVKSGQSKAMVSAGNTGVLMAMSRYVLKMLPGVDRPAISAVLPTRDPNKDLRMLDLGANVDASSDVLLQFAVIGSLLSMHVDGIRQPRVGLLNIGEEHHKGNDTIKRAAQLLEEHSEIHYVGFVEPHCLFNNQADVVVCDGLLGNVALKSIEGTTKLLKHFLANYFKSGVYGRLVGLICYPLFKKLSASISTSKRNGATLAGLRATVIKSHGSATTKGFAQAIKNAYDEVSQSVPDKINQELTI